MKIPSIRIAAAQSISIAGDIAANVQTHIKFIDAAHRAAVDLLVFPELSLSGYELAMLKDCLVTPHDHCLTAIRDKVRASNMIVVVGAPVCYSDGVTPAIAAITFFPDGRNTVYLKHHLHAGEEKFVAKGDAESRCDALSDELFSLAICADTAHEQHALNAAKTGASLYLAGVLISEAGYVADTAKMQNYASKFNFGVLMANHGGPSGGYVSAGKSAFWAPGGEWIVAAPQKWQCTYRGDQAG